MNPTNTYPAPPYRLEDILLLGDPRLYQKAEPVHADELAGLKPVVQGLADLVSQFRARYGRGRAIAAPQIGVMKQLVVLHIDQPLPLYNPRWTPLGPQRIRLWDDCMSFPSLLVELERYRKIHLTYRDENWKEQTWDLEDDMAELLQHECDHLEGILATMRALDKQAFRMIRDRPNPQFARKKT